MKDIDQGWARFKFCRITDNLASAGFTVEYPNFLFFIKSNSDAIYN